MENLKDLGSFLELDALDEDFTSVEALKDELKCIQEKELGDAARVCNLHPDCTSDTLECFAKRFKNPRNKSKNVNEDGVFINIASGPYELRKGVAKDGWPYMEETIEKSQFKEQQISQYKEKKSNISIVFLGHAGCGKSTTMGHMIHKLGGINKGMLKRAEEQAAAMNKYAWVLDKLKAERECGDINLWKLETSKYHCTFIDAPGHRDFINNMINGLSIADAAILVIDSTSTTNGMNVDTYDHTLTAFALGVDQIICCCNKMDATDPIYSEATYKEIMKVVKPQLKKIGFKKISSLPISGFHGDNLVERSGSMKWHMGATLLEAIDRTKEPKRPSHFPLRVPLIRAYETSSIGTMAAVGYVATGVIKFGMAVTIGPIGLTTKVETLEKNMKPVEMALPGGCIEFCLKDVSLNDLKQGFVVSNSMEDPAKEAANFTAKVLVIDHPGEIRNGYTPVILCHNSHIVVKFSEILSKIDWESEKELEKEPKCLKKGDAGLVKMIPTKPMVVETFSEYAPLGRFVVRDLGKTVAFGFIKSVDKK